MLSSLFTGFADCQEAYSPYPNALLCIRFINEVGRMIIGDACLEPGEVKEGDARSRTNTRTSENVPMMHTDHRSVDNESEVSKAIYILI